jgi:hypothetical protein
MCLCRYAGVLVQAWVEEEAKRGLADHKRKGAPHKGGPQKKTLFKTPDKDGSSDGKSDVTSPDTTFESTMATMASSFAGIASAQQEQATARRIEAETRSKEVDSASQKDLKMMELMNIMMQQNAAMLAALNQGAKGQ